MLATGFNHNVDSIEGLNEMEQSVAEHENVFVHKIDSKDRANRNYQHGWLHAAGDMICYSPQGPYKGEGTDFYALYYESFLRQDQ